MSFTFASLNSPPLVATAGTAMILGLPALEVLASSTGTLGLLKGANVLAFLVNVGSVSVPGRLDEQQDQSMRRGVLNPAKPTGQEQTVVASSETPLVSQEAAVTSPYSAARTRALVNPAGWAFSIWGPIYLGEAVFAGAQLFASSGGAMASILPQVTAPFVAANLLQSLWCASFRPSYSDGWKKFVSPLMLAGTAYSLSHVHAVACSAEAASLTWYFVPMTMHFGWTTAATFVNLNGSVAMMESTSDQTVIALGHASAVAATAAGVGVTLAQAAPTYGLTLAWALAACGSGMKTRVAAASPDGEQTALIKASKVQQYLCWTGSAACIAASAFAAFS